MVKLGMLDIRDASRLLSAGGLFLAYFLGGPPALFGYVAGLAVMHLAFRARYGYWFDFIDRP